MGKPPKVDLEKELKTGQFILQLNELNLIQSAHDLSDGGLAIAAAEMTLMGPAGISLDADNLEWLFGEEQSRYLISCWPKDVSQILNFAKRITVPAVTVGSVEGKNFCIGYKSIKRSELQSLHENGLQSIFD